jgi:hypothetical protein
VLAPGFLARSGSRVEQDVECLLTRMRQRFYPETIPVLASFWLRTVAARGYGLRQWKQFDRLLTRVLSDQLLSEPARRAVVDIREWIQRAVILTGHVPPASPPRSESARVTVRSGWLSQYTARLLNEWLPIEVARMLVKDEVSPFGGSDAVPVLAIGAALEALLVRERLSTGTLETLLQPELFSPHDAYPADVEMLRDVVLWLLDRTAAPPLSIMPATLLYVAPGSTLPANFRDSVSRALLVQRPEAEEVHIPIAPARLPEILRDQPVRLASVVVTMDGRWWEPENLQSGMQNTVVYRPVGRLRVDYSADHLTVRVPWPEGDVRWRGRAHFPGSFEIFGREWHALNWEKDSERAWLCLVFSRVLPMAAGVTAADAGLRQSYPASVDMAWAALGNALANSLAQGSSEPIERLRNPDLIPLGRSIFGLAALLLSRGAQSDSTIESQAAAIRYWESQVSPAYGRVPWRILPAPVRAALFRYRLYPHLMENLSQVFDSLPEKFTARRQGTLRGLARFRRFPPRAA